MSTNLSRPCMLHQVSVQSLNPSSIVAFPNEILLFSLYLGLVVIHVLNYYFKLFPFIII